MSETVRSYTGTRSLKAMRRRRRRPRGCFPFRWFFLFLVALAGAYVYWVTRDTHSPAQLIPAHQKYNLVLREILSKRGRLAESSVWRAFPAEWGVGRVPEMLSRNVGMPEWVVNNLAVGDCYISGNDMRSFDDALIVTRMSHIGAILERILILSSKVDYEHVGGLGLRVYDGGRFLYAVRGRVIVLSPSREALIQSLTLHDGDMLGESGLSAILAQAGSEDLRGTVALDDDDPMGTVLQYLRFSARLDALRAHVSCRARLRGEWAERAAPLLEGLRPQPLLMPPDGMAGLSLNMGRSVKSLWLSLEPVLGRASSAEPPLFSEERWAQWQQLPAEGPPGFAQFLTALTADLGPGMRIGWHGVDLNELLPVPELVAVFETGGSDAKALLDALPEPPAGAQPWDPYPRRHAETGLVSVPMLGGPSIEPTAGVWGDHLLLSTSRSVAEALVARPPAELPLDRPGNIYLRVKPLPCVQAVIGAGQLLVDVDALRGYTEESYREASAAWEQVAGRFDEVAALAAFDQGEIAAELTLACAP